VRQLATSLGCCRCQDARRHRQSSTRAQRHRRPTSSRPPPPQALMTLPAIALPPSLCCVRGWPARRSVALLHLRRSRAPPAPKQHAATPFVSQATSWKPMAE
jgi:hypothetical protein